MNDDDANQHSPEQKFWDAKNSARNQSVGDKDQMSLLKRKTEEKRIFVNSAEFLFSHN